MKAGIKKKNLGAFLSVFLLLATASAWAAPGDLDASFGDGKGWVSTSFMQGIASAAGEDVVQQVDGKLVVAGEAIGADNTYDFALLRYNADGSLDTTFNGTGKLTTAIGTGDDRAYSVIQQADGKLVVAGYSDNGSNSDFALVRYNADGSLDTSFNGTGKVVTAVGTNVDYGRSVIQQADGKLVVAGYSYNGSKYDFALVRYNAEGSLDTTLNGTGKVTTAIGARDDRGWSVIQQADGKLVVAGAVRGANNTYDFALVRYKTDGSLDTTFNSTGKLTTELGTNGQDFCYSVIQQADGKLVAAGMYSGAGESGFALVRYNANGWLDTTFNGTGKVVTAIGTNSQVNSVIQQADGKLVAVGMGRSDSGSNYSFALVRYNSNGSLDTTFNDTGKVVTAIGVNEDVAHSVIQQVDGKLVAAGYSNSNATNVALVRYNNNGLVDTSLDDDGKVITPMNRSTDVGRSIIQQRDGKLIAAGYTGSGSESDFALARYATEGSLDTAFDGGKFTTAIGVDNDAAYSVIQQSDNKLVAAGYSYNGSDYDFALMRYNIDGTLDTSFNGTGKTTTSVGAGDDYGQSVIQQANGKLVVAGYSYNGSNYDFALVRYNTDGSLDTTFNGIGKITTAMGTGDDRAYSVIQQANGKLVVAGYSYNGSNYDFALARYNINGTLDTSFDGDGKITTAIGAGNDYVQSLIQQADGKFVAVGYSNNGSNDDFALVRYNSNGALDTSFDDDGKLTTAIGMGNDYAQSAVQQADGKLVAVGYSNNGSNDDFALVRYNANGSLDTTFNGIGKLTKAIGTGDDRAYSLIQQADGKLAVVGYAAGMPTGQEFVVARFESGQSDTDNDGLVDGLDPDNDNDGVPNTEDAFPLDAAESADTDGDGIGDNSDAFPNDPDESADADNDGVGNNSDNCPSVSNSNQLDWDNNGVGDACDAPVPVPGDVDGTAKAEKTGAAVAFAGDFNGDGYGDYVIGSPRYSIPAAPPVKAIIGAGKAEVISGKDGSVLASITGTAAKDAMGFAVAGGSDIDKDGFADVVVGAPNATALHVGSVTVLYGGAGNRTHTFWGATKNTGFGSALALGDVNGDDYADVLIGAPKDKSPASSQKAAGSVTVFDGNTLQSRKRFYGLSSNAHAGTSVAAGDVDNDGIADIIVGAPDESGVGSVRVYDHSGTELLQKIGTNKKAQFGKALASADINHDGYADIVVGAPLDDDLDSNTKDAGSISVISGSNGELLSAKQFGAVKKAWLGSSVALGDVNGDGTLDIIAGAPQDNNVPSATQGVGSVTVWNGATYAPIKTVYGDAFGDLFGAAVSAGDINSDGKADLIIGIPNKDVELESSVQKDAGGVKVINALQL